MKFRCGSIVAAQSDRRASVIQASLSISVTEAAGKLRRLKPAKRVNSPPNCTLVTANKSKSCSAPFVLPITDRNGCPREYLP